MKENVLCLYILKFDNINITADLNLSQKTVIKTFIYNRLFFILKNNYIMS
jgi:hypothetical protein